MIVHPSRLPHHRVVRSTKLIDDAPPNTTFRIVPRRGTYTVEAVKPNGDHQVLGTWRTEDAAVSHLRDLQARALRADYRPMPGEIGWPPPPRHELATPASTAARVHGAALARRR